MTGPRAALGAGLLYGVPFTLWLFAQALPGPLPPDLSMALPVLAGCQALVLVLLPPVGTCAPKATTAPPPPRLATRLAAAIPIALLIMVPWPVLALVLATGTVTPAELALTQGAVALWGLLLAGLGRASRRLPPPRCRAALGVLQGLALLVLLSVFDLYRSLPVGALVVTPAGH